MRKFEISLSPYDEKTDGIWGMTLRSMEVFKDDDHALRLSKEFIAPKMCVVVRPQDLGPGGELYEYRSINGSEFKRVSFGRVSNLLDTGTVVVRNSKLWPKATIVRTPLECEESEELCYTLEFPDGDKMDVLMEWVGPGKMWQPHWSA